MTQRWAPGRYTQTADYLFPAAEAAVDAVAPTVGSVLLDCATGTGNAAAVALDRGARVIGVDFSAQQIDAARQRLPAGEFLVADAENLPLPADSVDAAVSVFGIIFAGVPARALGELVRCVRSGGSIAFTTLSADGWPNRARAILAAELGAEPPVFPTLWSAPAAAERAAVEAGLTDVEVHTHELRLPLTAGRGAAEQVTERLGALSGLRARLTAGGGWDAASARLDDYLASCVRSADGAFWLADSYLVVCGRTP